MTLGMNSSPWPRRRPTLSALSSSSSSSSIGKTLSRMIFFVAAVVVLFWYGYQFHLLLSFEQSTVSSPTTTRTTTTTMTTTTDKAIMKHSMIEYTNTMKAQSAEKSVTSDLSLPNVQDTIRKWGCGISNSPFLFVHVGKAGGGTVRARLAASSHNYTKGEDWREYDDSYYPFPNNSNDREATPRKATFCTSRYPHQRPIVHTDFEGVWGCKATTPIGQMIGCPVRWKVPKDGCYCNASSTVCDVVYVGHNFVGSELHWLPGPYLESWWRTITSHNRHKNQSNKGLSKNTLDASFKIADQIVRLTKSFIRGSSQSNPQCYTQDNVLLPHENIMVKERVIPPRGTKLKYDPAACTDPFGKIGDDLGREWLLQQPMDNQKTYGGLERPPEDWSKLYASLPVARVTVLRDPFSWLVSKYFWHSLNYYNPNVSCDDVEYGTRGAGRIQQDQLDVLNWESKKTRYEGGWIAKWSMAYIMYLCGEDCVSRLHYGTINGLDELYLQAKHNLQHSFTVVGLFNETDSFLDMISKRMSYIDTSLNLDVKGDEHHLEPTRENKRCKKQFTTNATLQQLLICKSPELKMLQDLYNIGVQVNRFQQAELAKC